MYSLYRSLVGQINRHKNWISSENKCSVFSECSNLWGSFKVWSFHKALKLSFMHETVHLFCIGHCRLVPPHYRAKASIWLLTFPTVHHWLFEFANSYGHLLWGKWHYRKEASNTFIGITRRLVPYSIDCSRPINWIRNESSSIDWSWSYENYYCQLYISWPSVKISNT